MNLSNEKNIKRKKCKLSECDNDFPLFNSLQKFCCFDCQMIDSAGSQKKEKKYYKIKQFSSKRQKENKIYTAKRIVFLSVKENSICFVEGCRKKATTIEHTKGRVGKNYLDETTWKGCCLSHNLEFENNTELSEKYQGSKFHEGEKIKKTDIRTARNNDD